MGSLVPAKRHESSLQRLMYVSRTVLVGVVLSLLNMS